MKHRLVVLLAFTLATLPVFAADATFDRTLTVSGRPELNIETGSGSIHLTTGPAGQIHIVGHVHSDWGGSADRVRDIAAHPPIEQTGTIVHIGRHMGMLQNISISYDIQAPADTYLDAGTGSGSILDEGVGANAHLHSGSGDIHATGLRGSFSLGAGSGNIVAEFAGPGNGKAETGSGNIELRNLQGGLEARAGSGDIRVTGTPAAPWQIDTGSGTVEIATGDAGFSLEASCGSGRIHSDRPVTGQRSEGKHHLSGQIGSGGPTVHIQTGSGDIRIH